jgi:hypothetical protein
MKERKNVNPMISNSEETMELFIKNNQVYRTKPY